MARMGWWVGVACGLVSGVAWPCSPPVGRPTVNVPNVSVIPANLLRFRLNADVGVEKLRMRDVKSGRLVPLEIRDGVLFANAQPQHPAEVALTYPLRQPFAGKKEYTAKFTVSLPAPLELRKPELVVVERGVKYPESKHAAGFVRVQFYAPDANSNAAHLLEYEATVDGRKARFTGNEHIIEVSSKCQAEPEGDQWGIDTCGALRNVPPGWHTVTVESHLIGEAKQPEPVSLRVNVQCHVAAGVELEAAPGEAPVGEPGKQLGGSQATVVSPTANPIASAANEAATANSPAAHASGCSVGLRAVPAGSSTWGVPCLGVVLMTAWSRGRRRRAG